MDHTIFVDELTKEEKEDQEDKNVTNVRLQEMNTAKVSKKNKKQEKIYTLRQRVEHDIVDKDYKKLLTKKIMVEKFPFMDGYPEMTFLHFAIEKKATKTVEYVMKLFNSYVKKHKPADVDDYEEDSLYHKIIEEVGRRKIINYVAEKLKDIIKISDNGNEDGEEKVKVVDDNIVKTNEMKKILKEKTDDNTLAEDRLTVIRHKNSKQLQNVDKFLNTVFPILTCQFTNKRNFNMLQLFIEEITPNSNDHSDIIYCLLLELTFDKILTSIGLSQEELINLLSNVATDGYSVFYNIAFFLQNVNHYQATCEIGYNIIENIWKKCAAIVDPYMIDDLFYFHAFRLYCVDKLPNNVRRLLPPNFMPDKESELRDENVYETQKKYLSKRNGEEKNFLQFICVQGCFRKMSDKIHPEVFNSLLHEKYNGSNCLELIAGDSGDMKGNYDNCNCDSDKGKTISECNIEFIMEHLKFCKSNNCLSLSELEFHSKKFINYIYHDGKNMLKILRQRVEQDVVDEVVKKILTVEFMVQELPFKFGYTNMWFLTFACEKKAKRTVEYVMKVLNWYVSQDDNVYDECSKPPRPSRININDFKYDLLLHSEIIVKVKSVLRDYVVGKMKEIIKINDNEAGDIESNDVKVIVDDNKVNTNTKKIQPNLNENRNNKIHIEDNVRVIKKKYAKQLEIADEFLDVVFPILTCKLTQRYDNPVIMLEIFMEAIKPNRDTATDIECCLLLELTFDKILTSKYLSKEQIITLFLSNVATNGKSVFNDIAFFLENANHSDQTACEISYNIIENIWRKCAVLVDPFMIEGDLFYFHTFRKYCDNELPNYVRRFLPPNFIPEDESELCNQNVYETQKKYLSKKNGEEKNFLHFMCVQGCFRKMSDKIHPEVFSTLLHEKYNGSNCLELIAGESDRYSNDNCKCDNDREKRIIECNIEFIMNHLKECTSNNCLSLSELEVDTKKFISYFYCDDVNVLTILRQSVESDVVDEDVKKILTADFIVQELPFTAADSQCFLQFALEKKASKTVEYVMKVLNSYMLEHKPVDYDMYMYNYEDDSLYEDIIMAIEEVFDDDVVDKMKDIMQFNDSENEDGSDSDKSNDENDKKLNVSDNAAVRSILEMKTGKYAKQLEIANKHLDKVFPILTSPCSFSYIWYGYNRNMLQQFVQEISQSDDNTDIESCLLLELTFDKILTSTRLSRQQIYSLLSHVDTRGCSVFLPIALFLAPEFKMDMNSDYESDNTEKNIDTRNNYEFEMCCNVIENIWAKCIAIVDPYIIEDDCFYFDVFGWYCEDKLPIYVRCLLPPNFIPENKSELCNEKVYETQKKYLSRKSDNKMNFLHRCCTRFDTCLRQISANKLHQKVFNSLLHERYNTSNCLHLIVEKISLPRNCNCEKDTDKTVLDCDIEFIMEHLENCTSNQCIKLSELNPDGKTFSQLLDTETLLASIKRLQRSKWSIGQLLASLDNTCLVDKKEANNYIEKKFKSGTSGASSKISRSKKSTQFESGRDNNDNEKSYEQTIQACIIAFRLQDTTLTKILVSSTFVECFRDKNKNKASAVELAKKLSEWKNANNNETLEKITDDSDFQEHTDLNLLYMALVAERYKICELLLITEQIDVIPNCLRVMLFCQYKKMIGGGKQNNNIDRLQAFCQTVLHNAFCELFRSVTQDEEVMLFQYICGTMKNNNGTTITQEIEGPLFKPFLINTKQDSTQKSILQMVEDVNMLAEMDSGTDDDTKFRRIFTLSCFTKLQQWLWNKYDRSSKSDKENVYGQKLHFSIKIFIDLLFLAIYTTYLLTGIYDNTPFQKPWNNFTRYWKHEEKEDVWYYYQLFHVFQSNFSAFLELLLVIYWIGIIIEEVKEIKWIIGTCQSLHRDTLKLYGWRLWLNVWNLADLFYIIMFGFFVGMRIAFYVTRNQDDIYISRYAPLRTHFISMFWIRIVAGLAYVAICFRRMHSICMIFKSMGVLYITFQQLITKDMRPFLTMLAVNILSFGVFFQVLLNPGSLSFFPNGTIDQHKLISLLDVYARPMMVAFGEYGLDDIGKCFSLDTLSDRARRAFPTIEFREVDECTHPAGTFLYAYFAIFIFMLIVNLTLFNLLIARFSLTVTRYNEEAVSMYYWYLYLEWKQLVNSRKVDTTPINILYAIIDFICCIYRNMTCCWCINKIQSSSSEQQQTFKESDEYLNFLLFQANAFSDKRDTFTNPIYETAKEVDSAVLKLQTSLNKQLDDMEISINKKLEKEIDLITTKQNAYMNSIGKRFDKLENLMQIIIDHHKKITDN